MGGSDLILFDPESGFGPSEMVRKTPSERKGVKPENVGDGIPIHTYTYPIRTPIPIPIPTRSTIVATFATEFPVERYFGFAVGTFQLQLCPTLLTEFYSITILDLAFRAFHFRPPQ